MQSNKLLDGCPTNCHTHVLTVTTTDDGSDLTESIEVSQNGTMENGVLCMCVYMCVCLCACVCTYKYVRTCVYVCVCVSVRVCVFMFMW